MRSRLHWSARGLALAVCAGTPVLGGGVAHADGAVAAGDTSTLLAAPVATGAICLGALGMIAGIVRKRRRPAEQASTDTGTVSADEESDVTPAVALRTGDTEVPHPRAERELPVRTPRG